MVRCGVVWVMHRREALSSNAFQYPALILFIRRRGEARSQLGPFLPSLPGGGVSNGTRHVLCPRRDFPFEIGFPLLGSLWLIRKGVPSPLDASRVVFEFFPDGWGLLPD